MTEFKLKDSARVRVRGSQKAVKERTHETVAYLAANGATRSSKLADHLGFSSVNSSNAILKKLMAQGVVQKAGLYYSLKGQAARPDSDKETAKTPNFFEGTGPRYNLRRWIRDHQDQPTTLYKMANASGYANASGVGKILDSMFSHGVLRRYQAPEDFGFMWRYQYVNDELSGVTSTNKPEPSETAWNDDEVVTIQAPLEEIMPKVEAVEEPVSEPQTDFINELEMAAKDYYWQTGGRDVRDMLYWLKDRRSEKRRLDQQR